MQKPEDPVHAATLRVVEAMGATADLYKMPLKLALALIDLEKAVKPGLEQQLANTLAKKCDELRAENEELRRRLMLLAPETPRETAADAHFFSPDDPIHPKAPADIEIVQPIGNCDGSRKYAYDPTKEDGKGARLAKPCPGCRACQ